MISRVQRALISGCWMRSKHGCLQCFFKSFTLWLLSTDIWLIFRYVLCELRAPEDFLWRYNLLDTSATRVVHYRLKSQESTPYYATRMALMSSRLYRLFRKSSWARNSHGIVARFQYSTEISQTFDWKLVNFLSISVYRASDIRLTSLIFWFCVQISCKVLHLAPYCVLDKWHGKDSVKNEPAGGRASSDLVAQK